MAKKKFKLWRHRSEPSIHNAMERHIEAHLRYLNMMTHTRMIVSGNTRAQLMDDVTAEQDRRDNGPQT